MAEMDDSWGYPQVMGSTEAQCAPPFQRDLQRMVVSHRPATGISWRYHRDMMASYEIYPFKRDHLLSSKHGEFAKKLWPCCENRIFQTMGWDRIVCPMTNLWPTQLNHAASTGSELRPLLLRINALKDCGRGPAWLCRWRMADSGNLD